MDIESTLIAKAISSGGLGDVIGRGIEPDHFADENISEVYEWCCDFYGEHQRVPSMVAVREEFPGFKPKLTSDPLSHHIKRFIHHTRERIAIEEARAYFDLLEDPKAVEEIEVHALEMASTLANAVPAPRASRLSEGKQRRQVYEQRKRDGTLHGLKMGIPTFDSLTLGQQPHELTIWAGPPGSGKTTMMQYQSLSAYFQMSGSPILFVSLEVEGEQIFRKFDVMLSNVRYRALKALELLPDEEQRWYEILERCEQERMLHDIIVRDDIKNCTPEKVSLEQMRYKSGMVVVDYLEEMRGKKGLNDWQLVRDAGQALKQNARTSKVPHVTGTQMNREGETAYQSTMKIADMLIVIEPPDEDDEEQDVLGLLMRKYRDGPSRKRTEMNFELDTGKIAERGMGTSFPNRKQALRGLAAKRRRNGHGALSHLRSKLND